MKKVVACLVFLGLLMASPLAYAQAAKIGSFDVDRVLTTSKRWAKEREAFVKKTKEWKQTLEKKAAELKALEESLQKKAGMLSEQARKEKEKEYQQKAREYDRSAQDARAELEQLDKESSIRFNKVFMTVIKKLGQEGNYTLIVEANLVQYVAKETDITDQVIKAVDAAKE
jgi:outer membrane protein